MTSNDETSTVKPWQIDLTQFEGHTRPDEKLFLEEMQEAFERAVVFEETVSDTDANLALFAPHLLAELKKCYGLIDELLSGSWLHHTVLENEDYMDLMLRMGVFERERIEGLAENEFKQGATYVYPANEGEEGRENLLSIERVDDGYYKPHYRVTEISYRGDFTTSTHSLYAGQWLIDDEQQKIDWDDIANHSKQWEAEYETWEDILSDNQMALEPK